MEGDLIRIPVDAERVVSPRGVQKEDVQAGYRGYQEGDEKMKGEKTCERGVVNSETSP